MTSADHNIDNEKKAKSHGWLLGIDDQMKISREALKKRNLTLTIRQFVPKMMQKPLPKDTRTDAQKMTGHWSSPLVQTTEVTDEKMQTWTILLLHRQEV